MYHWSGGLQGEGGEARHSDRPVLWENDGLFTYILQLGD